MEDFVDEDTGEVVSIERNDVIIDRETVLEADDIDRIIDSGAKSILLHKENATGNDYSIIYNTLQKDPCNSEKEAVVYIYRQIAQFRTTRRGDGKGCHRQSSSSPTNATTWAKWAVSG